LAGGQAVTTKASARVRWRAIINEYVKKPMADELLFGKLKDGGIVKIDIDPADDTKLKFTYLQEPRGLLSFGKKPEKA
jgi:ATP-dependent Clp protease ATP-binding subunit ClpA